MALVIWRDRCRCASMLHMTTATGEQRSTGDGWTAGPDTFGARLALVRQRMGWNITEAARECGLGAESWRLWEQGREPHRLVTIAMAIANKTGCDYLWLVHGPDRGGTIRSNNYGPEPHVVVTAGALEGRPNGREQVGPYFGHPVRQTRPTGLRTIRPATPVPA